MAFVYHQIFCDESGKYHENPLIAFSGVMGTSDRLNGFDREWGALLRSYELNSLHMENVTRLVEDHGYKFRKGQTFDERTELLFPFADCINKYFESGFIQAWSVIGLNRMPHEAIKLLGGSRDPYFWAFVRGLAEVVDRLGEDDRVAIICDDDETTAWDCYNHYRSAGRAKINIQKKAMSLSFANDKHVLALQAADMVAFLTKTASNRRILQNPESWRRLFIRLTTEPEPAYGIMRWFPLFANERELVDLANEILAENAKKKNEKNNRIRKVRQNDGGTPQGFPQSDKAKTGSGKRGKAQAQGR